MNKHALVPVNLLSGEVIDYDNLPPYMDLFKSNKYKCRYAFDVEFENVIIRFGTSRSKKFRSALKVLNQFPKALQLPGDSLGIELTSCKHYFIYKKQISDLTVIIYNWKSTEIIINGETASSTDLRDFFWIFQERLNHFDFKELLPPLKPINDADFIDIDTIEPQFSPHQR